MLNKLLPQPTVKYATTLQNSFINPEIRKKMREKSEKRSRIIGLRLTQEEFKKIEKKWKSSTSQKLSVYIRNVLLERPVVTTYRNKSLDEFMQEAARMRQEINHIGNNFNQAVKRLNTLSHLPEFRSWLIAYEVSRKTLFNKIEEIKNHLHKFAESWLQ